LQIVNSKELGGSILSCSKDLITVTLGVTSVQPPNAAFMIRIVGAFDIDLGRRGEHFIEQAPSSRYSAQDVSDCARDE
jgi:hypothetical protein